MDNPEERTPKRRAIQKRKAVHREEPFIRTSSCPEMVFLARFDATFISDVRHWLGGNR